MGETPDVFRFDVGAQYTFEMGDSELDLSVDIFNLFNLQKPVEVNETESSGGVNEYSLMTTAYQAPRQYRVSLRYTL